MAMEPTYFAQYRGFDFRCSPERIGPRTFAPRLVIHAASESLTLEIPLEIPSAPFDDPTAAAHHAFAVGRRWVDSGFDASMFPSGIEPAFRLPTEAAA
jgi:hypothetical protein